MAEMFGFEQDFLKQAVEVLFGGEGDSNWNDDIEQAIGAFLLCLGQAVKTSII
jgi:hypothetical protein